MSQNRTFLRTPKPYKKPTENVAVNANLEQSAPTQKPLVNGAKSSGKPSQTPLQYGRQPSSDSVTSQNGGASVINISDKGQAVAVLSVELKELEALQLTVGEKMSVLLFEQMRLAEKCRAINRSMEALIK